jgi:hypothetical protein
MKNHHVTNYKNDRVAICKNTVNKHRPLSFAIIAIVLLLSTASLNGVYAKEYDTHVSERSGEVPLSNKDSRQSAEPMIRTESSMIAGSTPTPTQSETKSNDQTTLPTRTSEETSTPSVMNLDGDFSTQAALQIPRTFQSTDIVSSTGWYQVTFITATAGAIDKIEIAFPAGTNIGAAGVIERIGIGGGTLTKVGSTLTYDVTTPVNIPAGTFIRLEISGIKNPINPSTTFTATITTRDSGGNPIDGPSQTNVYTIKQIGTNDIADDAVTSSKIAPGTVATGFEVQTFVGTTVNVAPNTFGTATAQCPVGQQWAPVSGGFTAATNGQLVFDTVAVSPANGEVTVRAFNNGAITLQMEANIECFKLLGNS